MYVNSFKQNGMKIWRNLEDVLKIRRFCHQHRGDDTSGGDGGKIGVWTLNCVPLLHS